MPPFNIFLSEFLVMTSGFGSGQFLAASLMILLLVVVFAGFLRHLVPMVFGSPEGPGRVGPGRSAAGRGGGGVLAILPMVILVALVVVLGFYVPQPLQTLIRDAVQVFGQGAPSMTADSPSVLSGPQVESRCSLRGSARGWSRSAR